MPEPQKPISLTIPGNPQTKLRPRFARVAGGVKTYDSQSEEKQTARWQIKARIGSAEPLEGLLHLDVTFIFVRPKSWCKNKKPKYHSVKPDLDNILKWVGDVGNKLLWRDDCQIVSISCKKIYGEEAETRIIVKELNE